MVFIILSTDTQNSNIIKEKRNRKNKRCVSIYIRTYRYELEYSFHFLAIHFSLHSSSFIFFVLFSLTLVNGRTTLHSPFHHFILLFFFFFFFFSFFFLLLFFFSSSSQTSSGRLGGLGVVGTNYNVRRNHCYCKRERIH